ncbi:MAG: hypothetical protein ACKOGJ_03730 [Phycisphaerales bacterium]
MRGARYLAVLAAASTALAGGTSGSFQLLGQTGLTPTDASADGRVVVGYNQSQFWFWTPTQGLVQIGGITPSSGGAGSAGVSDDGTRMGYTVINPQTGKTEGAFHDIPSGGTTPIGSFGFSCDLGATSCWGISGDGTTMVGLGWHLNCAARGYRFSSSGGLVDLGSSVPGSPSRANACNVDGTVIAGWQDSEAGARMAAVWTNGVQRLITTNTGAALGEAGGVSAEGNWVIGQGSSSNGFLGWRWSLATGYLPLPASPIPTLPRTFPTAISQDGSRVLLFYRTQFPPSTGGEGYMWINGSLVSLEVLAAQAGIALTPDIRMALPLGMSRDGYTVVGTARTASGVQGFILDLPRPAPCPADLNADAAVNGDDLGILLGAWGACPGSGCPADLNGDATVNGDDLGIMLGAWGACGAN